MIFSYSTCSHSIVYYFPNKLQMHPSLVLTNSKHSKTYLFTRSVGKADEMPNGAGTSTATSHAAPIDKAAAQHVVTYRHLLSKQALGPTYVLC